MPNAPIKITTSTELLTFIHPTRALPTHPTNPNPNPNPNHDVDNDDDDDSEDNEDDDEGEDEDPYHGAFNHHPPPSSASHQRFSLLMIYDGFTSSSSSSSSSPVLPLAVQCLLSITLTPFSHAYPHVAYGFVNSSLGGFEKGTVSDQYEISSYPAFLLFSSGKCIGRVIASADDPDNALIKDKVEAMINAKVLKTLAFSGTLGGSSAATLDPRSARLHRFADQASAADAEAAPPPPPPTIPREAAAASTSTWTTSAPVGLGGGSATFVEPRAARLARFNTPTTTSTTSTSSISTSTNSNSTSQAPLPSPPQPPLTLTPTSIPVLESVEDPIEKARLQILSKHKKRREEEKSERARLKRVLEEDKAERIQRGIIKPSPSSSSSSTSSTPSASASAGPADMDVVDAEEMSKGSQVSEAISSLVESGIQSMPILRLIQKILGNVEASPNEVKYRSVSTTGKAFTELARYSKDARAILAAVGFKKDAETKRLSIRDEDLDVPFIACVVAEIANCTTEMQQSRENALTRRAL